MSELARGGGVRGEGGEELLPPATRPYLAMQIRNYLTIHPTNNPENEDKETAEWPIKCPKNKLSGISR